jgi:NAD(P)H-flavin reductase
MTEPEIRTAGALDLADPGHRPHPAGRPGAAVAPGASPYDGAPGSAPMLPSAWRVLRNSPETHDTFTLELAPAEKGRVCAFAPGQFNMLYAFGAGEAAISISGPPGEPGRLVHTIRGVGMVTRLLAAARRGDEIGVRGPFGTSWDVEAARGHDVVVLAGGIGLAPLRPVIYHLLEHRERYGRVVLLFGARTPDDLLFTRELESWRGRFDVEVDVIVDRATSSWRGNVGVVTSLIPRAHFDPDDAIAFICGPQIMMEFAARDLQKAGVTPDCIYISMERNMRCGIGHCGHCQLGTEFVCKDGPVFRYDFIRPRLGVREL